MITTSGIDANLVNSPTSTNEPHTISNVPTKGPKNSGFGNQIFANRPEPSASAKRNFWIPSLAKTAPTIRRIRMVVAELSVLMMRFGFMYQYVDVYS